MLIRQELIIKNEREAVTFLFSAPNQVYNHLLKADRKLLTSNCPKSTGCPLELFWLNAQQALDIYKAYKHIRKAPEPIVKIS